MACWRGVCRLVRGARALEDEDEEAEAEGQCRPDGTTICLSPAPVWARYAQMHCSDNIQDHYRVDCGNSGSLSEIVCTTVGLATSLKTDIAHAVKVIVKGSMGEGMNVQSEISLTKSLSHPNVVKLHETFEDNLHHYLVMELCRGGELFEHVVRAESLAEWQAVAVMRQIFLAVAYLHSQLICHRDLKPENFIFAAKGPMESTTLKLIDFGLSRRFTLGEALTTVVGTALYVAPEVLAQDYGPACDLWSLGVLMYCFLSGCMPFDAPTASKVLKNVRKGRFKFEAASWASISAGAKGLICQLLERDVESRLSALQAQEHEWIRDCAPGASGEIDPDVLQRLRTLGEENRRARHLQRAAMVRRLPSAA